MILGLALAGPAEPACRQALVLAVDISGSVDLREHGLQRQGLAAALLDAEVQAAFLELPAAPVRLLVFEWAGSFTQTDLTGWTEVRSAADLAAVARRLASAPRADGSAGTATGQAMLYGAARLAEQAACARLTLDISTDGVRNAGVTPGLVRRQPEMQGVIVNGLAIGTGWPSRAGAETQLDRILWFLETEVVQGPDAFVEIADGFEDFERAMKLKLIRELTTRIVGQAGPPAPEGRG